MCQVLLVSHSAYYKWSKDKSNSQYANDFELTNRIKQVFIDNRSCYGSRRITKALAAEGINTYRQKTMRLMRENSIQVKQKRKYKVTTDSKHTKDIASNLLQRNFKVDSINKVWVGDITFIYTSQGWVYLSIVIDLYSRKVVAWSISTRIDKDLVIESLLSAIKDRKPKEGLIFHSDRGSQYSSEKFKEILMSINAKQSMSRKGDCWDNAVAESFFKTIKQELISKYKFRNIGEVKLKVFEYIEAFYNTRRLHSFNNYLSPNNFECSLI